MGRFKSLRFDFYVFNFDTMKVILFGKSAEKPSVFVDKAVNQIITAAESAMGEKPSCKATD